MTRPRDKRFHRRHPGPKEKGAGLWLYGLHAVKAALANPARKLTRAVLTDRAAGEIGAGLLGRVRHETTSAEAIGRLLPPGAVHQGAALLCEPLPRLDLENAINRPLPNELAGGIGERPQNRRVVLVLDQISDPHNVGAILRSAAAFGVSAVVVQDRHAPPESGVLAKAASGALDIVPYVQAVNVARALDELAALGFWRVALTGDGDQSLKDAVSEDDIAIVLGSEGSGLRRLVRERCDTSATIPIDTQMESLNVSNAAAIALYEIRRG